MIEITDQEIRWTAPQRTEESSFIMPVSDISELRCITSPHANTVYELVSTSGNIQILKPSLSGINIEEFIICLEQQGSNIVQINH